MNGFGGYGPVQNESSSHFLTIFQQRGMCHPAFAYFQQSIESWRWQGKKSGFKKVYSFKKIIIVPISLFSGVAQHDCDCCCYVLRHCSCIILSASTYKFRVSDNALLPIYSRSRLQSSKHVHYSVQRSNHFQYVNYAHVLHNLSICLLISAFFIVLCAMIKSHSVRTVHKLKRFKFSEPI